MINLNVGDTQLIIHECKRLGCLRNQAAYILATAKWETAHTMEPIREAKGDTDEQSIARLDNAFNRGQLPWVSKPYWKPNSAGNSYFGRGYVQLTHDYNYKKQGDRLGIDLLSNPNKTLEPNIAVNILVHGMMFGEFTGKPLTKYVTLQKSNYVGARAVVNGSDEARTIAEIARNYEQALIVSGYSEEKVAPLRNDKRDGTPAKDGAFESTTIRAVGIGSLSQIINTIESIREQVNPYTSLVGMTPDQAFGAITILAFAWIFRERLRKLISGEDV